MTDSGVIRPISKSLRIAMLSLHSSPLGPLGTRDTGGMSVYVREVAREMARCGHTVDIYTYAPCPDGVIHLDTGVRLIELDHRRKPEITKEGLVDHLSAMAHALDRFARRHRLSYDLVHSHYWISGWVGDTVSRKWGSPHLVTFHTLGLAKNRTTEGEAEPDVRITHERRLVAAASAIVVPSVGEHRHLLDHYDAASEKVQIIPCGVNMAQFRPTDKGRARRRLHLDPAAAILLFVGRFAPVKGIPTLLQAVAEVAQRQALVKLVVVGGDGEPAETTQEIRRQAEELGIAARLQMTGRIDHGRLPLFYSAADMLVLPSTYESFGLVTLESLACGTPVVATRVGGAAAVIEEGVNGTLIDGSDHAVLAAAIERVLAQVRGGRLYVRRMRQSVAPYGWKHVASSIVSVYKDLLRCPDA